MDVAKTTSRGAGMMRVEVAYALPDRQTLLALEVPIGSTVEAVIKRSGILDQHPGITLDAIVVGIFSQRTTLDQIVTAHDRIEIYRPLEVDPKAQRRERAQRQRAADSSGGAA